MTNAKKTHALSAKQNKIITITFMAFGRMLKFFGTKRSMVFGSSSDDVSMRTLEYFQ